MSGWLRGAASFVPFRTPATPSPSTTTHASGTPTGNLANLLAGRSPAFPEPRS